MAAFINHLPEDSDSGTVDGIVIRYGADALSRYNVAVSNKDYKNQAGEYPTRASLKKAVEHLALKVAKYCGKTNVKILNPFNNQTTTVDGERAADGMHATVGMGPGHLTAHIYFENYTKGKTAFDNMRIKGVGVVNRQKYFEPNLSYNVPTGAFKIASPAVPRPAGTPPKTA